MPVQDSLAVVASAFFAAGLESDALESALACIGSTGGHPWALGVSGVVLAATGRDSLGRAAVEQAVQANRNPCTLTLGGHVEMMAGRYADAAGLYRAAVSMAPASPALRIDLASALWNSGELAGSAEQYEAAAGLGAPLPPSGLSRLGWARVICSTSPLLDTPGRGGQF
jgi:tetratricopeptide (TPR) repeat protein